MKRLLKLSLFLLVIGLLTLVAVSAGVNAQDEAPTPGPEQPTLIPACQLYHLTVDEGVARSCAGSNCRVEGSVDDTSALCIRGIADNSDWFIIDLAPEEADSPLNYINASIVAIGPPGQEEPAECEPWLVGAEEAVVRQCPSSTCTVLGGLPPETWLCARGYGGEYEDWVNMDYSEVSDMGGWLHVSTLKQSTSASAQATVNTPPPPVTPTDTQVPDETTNGSAVVAASPTATQPALLLPATTEAAMPMLPICPTESAVAGVNPFDTDEMLATATLPPIATHTAVPSSQEFTFADEFPYMTMHIVERGETLGSIASRLDSSVEAIRESNALGSNSVILVGQELLIPVREATTEASLAATVAPATQQPAVDPLLNCVTATPTPLLAAPERTLAGGPLLAQDVTLDRLQIDNMILISPQGSTRFRVTLPTDWQPDGRNILYLNTEYFETGNRTTIDGVETFLISQLNISLDGDLISSVRFTEENVGQQTLAIPLPVELINNPDDRNHTFELSMLAEDHCLADTESRIFIRSDQSYIHFEYFEYLPVLDLALYPQPFYTEDLGPERESVVLVLPSDPSANDLEAAAGISAGLGNLTFGDLAVRTVTDNNLTEVDRQSNNLILIGESGSNALIEALYGADVLLTKRDADGEITFNGQSVGDDGVVQLIAHPENRMKAIGVITGQSPEALRKAAQAVSGPPSIMGLGGPLALISETRPPVVHPTGLAITERLTFKDLGYDDITVSGIGLQAADVKFSLPTGVVLTSDAHINLLFNYSDVLAGKSTVTILMNGAPLNSFLLAPINSAAEDRSYALDEVGRYNIRIPITPRSVVPGLNTMTLVVDVDDYDWDCNYPEPLVTWFTAYSESSLVLPHHNEALSTLVPLVGWFPNPFNTLPDLSNVLISLPAEPTAEDYEQTMKFAARLGASTSNGEAFAPIITVGELPADTNLADYHFIVLGRPTTNPFLSDLNDNLPQPFVPGTDELQQVLDNVSYRMPPGYDAGVLQTLHSPWAAENIMLVVTGTSPSGQSYAANALTDELYGQSELQGDVVFVSSNAVSVVDTRTVDDAIEILTAMPELSTESAINAQSPSSQNVAVTVTPGPTATPSPTFTPSMTLTATPLFTPTVAPTLPTVLPTFPPLSPELMQPVEVVQPPWVSVLLTITGVALLLAVVAGLIQLFRGRRQD
ncbi:cellulose biosynthesis cyclic di-GMP-binding regulatory protein BcsB [Chloroflexota bacterium]